MKELRGVGSEFFGDMLRHLNYAVHLSAVSGDAVTLAIHPEHADTARELLHYFQDGQRVSISTEWRGDVVTGEIASAAPLMPLRCRWHPPGYWIAHRLTTHYDAAHRSASHAEIARFISACPIHREILRSSSIHRQLAGLLCCRYLLTCNTGLTQLAYLCGAPVVLLRYRTSPHIMQEWDALAVASYSTLTEFLDSIQHAGKPTSLLSALPAS
jgi:hypothetical protein